jgi:glutamate-ammonia-ligase adenylyltransferase
MLERIRRGRGSASDELDFKTGLGGVIEAEFLVQALQMRSGIWNPQMIGALEQLVEAGIMRQPDADKLRQHYEYLRSIGSALRRWENKSVSTLPADKTEQEKLAVRAGAKSLDDFARAYREARTGIHAIYSKYLL